MIKKRHRGDDACVGDPRVDPAVNRGPSQRNAASTAASLVTVDINPGNDVLAEAVAEVGDRGRRGLFAWISASTTRAPSRKEPSARNRLPDAAPAPPVNQTQPSG